MSPELPVVSGAQTVQALGRVDFREVNRRGSHAKLRHPDGRVVIVPMHKELARGTLRSILRQAGLSPQEFADLL